MEPKTIDFHYIKAQDFRTHHADGAIGGLTPTGDISITFYLERASIPQMMTMEISEEGTVGREISRQGKIGVIRELECGVVMNQATAKRLFEWLSKTIEKADNTKGEKNG